MKKPNPFSFVLVAFLALAGALPAQKDEPTFMRAAAERLDAYALRCFRAKYPLRAREIWQEVIRDYDPDDEAARKALGFLRVGSSWAPDSRFEYPTKDEPDPAVARILQKSWESLAEDLGEGHRELAKVMLDAGMPERAKYHFERTLRFLPEDPTAIAQSGRRSFEGLFGSDLELDLLERSRKIDRNVARLLETDYDVKPVDSGTTHKLIDRASVPYRGFESEHFVVWGDWSDDVLIECAKYAERSLEFCGELYEGYERFKWPVRTGKFQYAFFQSRETWADVLRANADRFQPGTLEFTIQNTSATGMGSGPDHVKICGFDNEASTHDMSVRGVAQAYAGLGADALVEGVGHAVVGWFFGRNLIFSVGQERGDGRTTTDANREAKLKLPDLSVWEELAVELAWDRTDTPAARLPLISAADFSSEDRIKSWAFCDYLLRRDPSLLKILDSTRSTSNVNQVATAFEKATDGLSLAALDEEWRRFWTDDTPILRAIKNKETPLEAISKKAPAFLEEFNDLRVEFRKEPVAWSAEYSADCKAHADYLLLNKRERGPIEEHTEDPEKQGGSLKGKQFAEQALVSTSARDPRKTFEDWLDWPGYRDAVLNGTLKVVGVYVESNVLVMDVVRGQTGLDLQTTQYPFGVKPGSGLSQNVQPGLMVPTEVTLSDLGPDVEELLATAAKKERQRLSKKIGYPISLHFFRTGALPPAHSIRCEVRENDEDLVPGVVHVADGGRSRRASAPGLVVFYPFQPLSRGRAYTVEWSFDSRGERRSLQRYQFFTK